MIKVNLYNQPTEISPLCMAEHAAKTCYQAEIPSFKKNDTDVYAFVKDRLFETGHHTTLQHQYFNFVIDGIAISDITFGLHLTSSFYNSDQRSGRFCGQMFNNPDYEWIKNYIDFFWPKINKKDIVHVLDFIKQGIEIYQNNIEDATKLSTIFLTKERPFLDAKIIQQNAPKIAQEQLRVFISTIMPTGLDFTINLSTLVALWKSAWTPVLRYTTNKMSECLLSIYPELKFMFDEKKRNKEDWSPELFGCYNIMTKPECDIEYCTFEQSHLADYQNEYVQPVDLLHFLPSLMDNNIAEIKTRVKISIATMGQDQRHRTIKRGTPNFTRNFYFPPIVNILKIKNKEKVFKNWLELKNIIPGTLHTAIAPYGVMVEYDKIASYNALVHEQQKRACLCAQEEIYHLSKELSTYLEKDYNINLDFLAPPCLSQKKCIEGSRYCGRDLKNVIKFIDRKV